MPRAKKADTLQVYATILCGDGRKLFLPGYNFHSDMDPNYAVYATVSMPLFEWGKRRNEKRASSFKMDMAAENLSKVTDGVNLEIQTARNSSGKQSNK